MLYRSNLLYQQPPAIKHIYFILTGLFQCYFNFGTDIYHSLLNIAAIYVLLRVAGGRKLSVICAFLFNTGYLVLGYYFENAKGADYSITWTMPHCVLTLRLTAVAFDLYDGHKRPVPADAKDTAMSECPSLLELLGQCYFFGGFLVGPQYNMQRYLNFVNGKYSDPATKGPPNSLQPALERFLLGIVYIGAFQVVYVFVSDDFLQSPAFQERGLLVKCLLLLVWGKTCLNKYLGSWLLTEGAIIYCGLSYNKSDNNNIVQWDACTNVRVTQLETGCTLHNYVTSFNCNTNLWMAKYIFKRLRFLGNKTISQCCTLFYLALWHGLYTGYYVCFFLEFVYITTERKIAETAEKVDILHRVVSYTTQPVLYIVKKIFSSFLLSFALVGFSLLEYKKWSVVYWSLSYIGFVIAVVLFVACVLMQKFLPRKSSQNGLTRPAKSQHSPSRSRDRQEIEEPSRSGNNLKKD